jgi:hypothetical protein
VDAGDGLYVNVGFLPATYTVYAWAKDVTGEITVLSAAGAGTDAIDRDTIQYIVPIAPVVTNVSVVDDDADPFPERKVDRNIANAETMIIRWNATDDVALPANPINIFYRENGTSWQDCTPRWSKLT